jgi:hypothetical protein
MDQKTEEAESPNSQSKMPAPANSELKPKKKLNKWLKLGLATVMVGLAGLAAWYAYNNFLSWPYKSLVIEGTTYSFKFPRQSSEVSQDGTKYWEGKDLSGKNTIKATAMKSPYDNVCSSERRQAKFNVQINGTEYPVCAESKQVDTGKNNSSYVAYFQSNGAWHAIEVRSADLTVKLDEPTVKKIISSVRVN